MTRFALYLATLSLSLFACTGCVWNQEPLGPGLGIHAPPSPHAMGFSDEKKKGLFGGRSEKKKEKNSGASWYGLGHNSDSASSGFGF